MRKTLIAVSLVLLFVACGDKELPVVTIANPVNNSVVSGNVIIEVEATDNKAVTFVEIYLDDDLVATDSTAPYTYDWNTNGLADSSTHTIHANALDAAENIGTSSTITVTVYNNVLCLIWSYNPGDYDKFYDSEVSDSVFPYEGLQSAIAANSYNALIVSVLPTDLGAYDAVFVTTGWNKGC